MKKAISIGIDNFKDIINKPYYYVDKTLLIKELLDQGGGVNLFTRPRRFGKTLALSMLKTYFEAEYDVEGNRIDNSHYFDGLKIMDAGEEYTRHLGQYPVISLSLKSAKQPSFDMAYDILIDDIAWEFKRHRYILKSDVLVEDAKRKYESLMSREAPKAEYATSLKFLSKCLEDYHNQKTIILIDEYDVPLENSWFRGFYKEMLDFIRSLFESALKTNDSLAFAVVTGCLRVSKESIFTGLNNLKTISVMSDKYAEFFGFLQSEVDEMLTYYQLEYKHEEIKRWYDGYLFGVTEVYNPWSVINYVDDMRVRGSLFPKPYWSNTSSNSIVRELVENANGVVKKEIEHLIAGGTIRKPVHEDITYGDIHKTQENLWNFLFFTGYLKMVKQEFEVDTIYLTLTIPNEEVRYIYRNTIREWFTEQVKKADFKDFYEAILNGDTEAIENFISGQLFSSISYHDAAENFYHGYLLGTLGGLNGYEILSNRETGLGRADIELKPYHPKMTAILFEIKQTDKFTKMDEMCDKALQQIEEKQYVEGLLEEGYQKVISYGICFCKKSCKIKMNKI